MNPQPKQNAIHLSGKALSDQNARIISRDKNLCGVCRKPPPPGNHWGIHHNLYSERADIEDEKISACDDCHINKLHRHIVPVNGVWVNMGSKRATQAWVRQRIQDLKMGRV